ncbi:unnamed protein product [Linum trigynum]|uniref:Uncharacterized protein n=1 Tax=Linum trigynum TaxID=586398 RepID=A0AAV2D980_9ROSI
MSIRQSAAEEESLWREDEDEVRCGSGDRVLNLEAGVPKGESQCRILRISKIQRRAGVDWSDMLGYVLTAGCGYSGLMSLALVWVVMISPVVDSLMAAVAIIPSVPQFANEAMFPEHLLLQQKF